jgi:hypothetical protein
MESKTDASGGGSETIRQLAVFVENRAGRLAEVCKVVAEGGNNIVGFSIADEEGFGIFRLIVDDPDRVQQRLREAGFTVKARDVLCVDVPHCPGGLHRTLDVFRQANLNVEYLYAVAESLICFSVDDIAAALKALREADIRLRKPGQGGATTP